ncbi:rRNA maturation RNase YbeY [Verrucomicrobiota bacterium]
MKISIQNRQTKYPVQADNLQLLADFLGSRLQELEPSLPWQEISILLLDDELITETNRQYFQKDRPTDVITFRYDPIPGEEGYDGDVLVNCERAIQVGPEHDGIQHELGLYIAHGFDHLSGAEDYTDEKRAAMRKTELAWLSEANKLDLLNQLIECK